MTDPISPLDPTAAAAPAGRSLPRALKPFRHSAYRRLAAALTLTSFATGLWIVGLVWEVIRIGGGASQLSVVTAAGAVGILVPTLLAGVVADRVRQKSILLGVAAVETAGMALVAVLSLGDVSALWHLAVLACLVGMGQAFYYPAYSAWLPALVPESDLLAANGVEGMVRPLIQQAIGPAVAGAVVGLLSPGAAVSLAALSALGSGIALLMMPSTPVRRELEVGSHPVAGMVRDMREGFVYMVRTPWLLSTLLFASLMVLVVIGPLEVLIPFLVKDRLGGHAVQHSWVLAAFGVGGALGSLTMASLRLPRRYLSVMILGWGLACLPFVAIGLATHVWMVVAAAFVTGALFSGPMVIWGTLLQRRVPPALLGRVASLDFFVSISLMPVSMALAGPVAEWIGLRNTFYIAGVVPVFIAVAAIGLAKLPADEIAHPLRDDEDAVASASGGEVPAAVAAEEGQ